MVDATTVLNPTDIARFAPLQHLSGDGLAELAKRLVIEKADPEIIISSKEKPAAGSVYLLEGEISLISSFGMRRKVCGPCLQPLHSVMPEIVQMVAKSPISFFRVDPALYREIMIKFPKRIQIQMPGQKAGASRRTDGESELYNAFKTAWDAGSVALPEISAAAIKISVLANNPDTNPKEFADLLANDTALSDRLIQVANSPQYRGNKSAFSVVEAVSRIGFSVTRNLVLCGTVKQLYRPGDHAVKKHVLEAAQTSIRVAAYASVIAQATQAADPDSALLAGLIHDIGVPSICQFAVLNLNLQWRAPELDELIARTHAQVGEAIVAHWELEEEFRTTVRDWSNPSRTAGEKADLCDIITVARAVADFSPASDTRIDSLASYKKLGLPPAVGGGKIPLLEEKKLLIQQTMDMLRG